MNADERNLINDLFERFRAYGPVEKDRDAETLIISHARNNPDAGYMLVQNLLVHEQMVQDQQRQIEDLQARIQELERASAPTQRSGGSFLGGARAGHQGGQYGGSVPPTARPAPPQYSNPAPAPSSPWGRTSSAPAPQGGYAQPMQPQAAPAQASGGGFMRSAMGMAAGVAGGMLAANAISSMMRGGQSGNQPASSDLGNNDQGNYNGTLDNTGTDGGASDAGYQADNNDPGNYTEAASDNSWDGGGDVEL